MEQARAHRVLAALGRVAEIMREVLRDTTALCDYGEELARLLPWLTTGDFDNELVSEQRGLPSPRRWPARPEGRRAVTRTPGR
jgi:hypothetical protein